MTNTEKPEIHQGNNVKRFREMLGLKQSALADRLGTDWDQRKVSLLEQKQKIEPGILEQVAQALKVPVEAIQNFDDQMAYNIIGNTLSNNDNVAFFQYHPTFNPIDKIVELYTEKEALYERMLKEKEEAIAMLQKQINNLNLNK